MNQLSLIRIIAIGWSECRGSWRRLSFFVVCLAVGVGAVMTIKSFSAVVESTVHREAKGLLAGDIEIKSSWALSKNDASYLKRNLPAGSDWHFVKELKAMAQYGDPGIEGTSLLVELKGLPTESPIYPFYGRLKFSADGSLAGLLENGGGLVEPSFLVRTGLSPGNYFKIGAARVRIAGTIDLEPDRISRAFSIGPRVMVSLDTLQRANLIRVGSKVNHRVLIRLPNEADIKSVVTQLESGLEDKTAIIRTYKAMQSSLNQSITQMSQYLGCIGVIALMMGGIGVAMVVRTFLSQKLDTIAVMNCLGATPRTIFWVYLIQAVMLGIAGSALGLALGFALQFMLPQKMEGLLDIDLQPSFHHIPALQAFLLGLLTTLLFSAWPLVRAVKTKPLRLFRNIVEEELDASRLERLLAGFGFSGGVTLILFWQAGSIKRGLVFFIALAVSFLILAGVAKGFIFLLRRMPTPHVMLSRYGISNIHRPNNQAVSIVSTLGMGIMLVLTIRLVQLDLVSMLKDRAEIEPPNYFFIDIQRDQEQSFVKTLHSHAPGAKLVVTPLIRSRFYSIDGRDVDHWHFKSAREERWIKREFVLTFSSGQPPPGNQILAGKWWDERSADTPQVSLEEDAASRFGAVIGSIITMDIQGVKLSATVTSIRRVDWRNMRTNFYMIFTPFALQGAPASLVATVHVPPEKELTVQNAIVSALPNVTALSTRDIVETVENVIRKIITIVDFMSAFSIIAGLFILSGAVAATKYRRLKESAILKILGASRGRVARILAVEYASLGVNAALVGGGLALVLSWAVMRYLVKAPWSLHAEYLVTTFVISVILTVATGVLSSLDVLVNKPFRTLRKIDG